MITRASIFILSNQSIALKVDFFLRMRKGQASKERERMKSFYLLVGTLLGCCTSFLPCAATPSPENPCALMGLTGQELTDCESFEQSTRGTVAWY